MSRGPFEYIEGCDGPEVDINVIPSGFPICEDVVFNDPKRLLTCTDIELIDFTIPPACACFPESMGLHENSRAVIKCLAATATPSISILGCKLVNVAPADCCTPDLRLDLQLDVGVPCPGPVGACARIIGQTDIEVKQHDARGKANLVFRRCVDDQGNFTNDPCCIQLFGEIILPCPDIDFIVDAEVTEDIDVTEPFLEIFTITPRLQPGDDPNPPCEYDVRFKLKLPKHDNVTPYDPNNPPGDNCCNAVGYCPDTKSFTDLGPGFTGAITYVSNIVCDNEGNLRVEKSEVEVKCGSIIQGPMIKDNVPIDCAGAKAHPPCCPSTTTTTDIPPTTTTTPTTPPPECECGCTSYYVCDNESGYAVPDIIVRVVEDPEYGCQWFLIDTSGMTEVIVHGPEVGCPVGNESVDASNGESYSISCYPCAEVPPETCDCPCEVYYVCDNVTGQTIPDYAVRVVDLEGDCVWQIIDTNNSGEEIYRGGPGCPADNTLVVSGTATYKIRCCPCDDETCEPTTTTTPFPSYAYKKCTDESYASYIFIAHSDYPSGNPPSNVTYLGDCYELVGASNSTNYNASYIVSACVCSSSEYANCTSGLKTYLPSSVTAATVTISGLCFMYLGPSANAPDPYTPYAENGCECVGSKAYLKCGTVDEFIYLPSAVVAPEVSVGGDCYEYYAAEGVTPPDTFDYTIEDCDCTTTTTTTTAAPDYYEYDACVEQPPTYQSVEYYECFDFIVNGSSSVFVYAAIDEISPGVLNNPTQIVVGGMCYTINGYSTTAVDTMSYTSGPCNCDNFSDEFQRCSDNAPIFIPIFTTFATHITYGGDCYVYIGPSTTEPDSFGAFTEDDCSC